MHEIYDGFTPRELKAIALREAGMTYREMGCLMGYTGARARKIYQHACRKREKWIAVNAQRDGLFFQLLPIINDIKELRG